MKFFLCCFHTESVLVVAQTIGLDQTDTEALLESMRELFDQIDVDTAAARYCGVRVVT